MRYEFKSKGISITTPMEDAAISALSMLDKFLEKDAVISVTVSKEGRKIKTTVLFNYDSETVKITDTNEDYYSILDTITDVLKTKMERLHDKKITKEHANTIEQQKFESPEIEEEPKEDKIIVKRKFIIPSQLTELEAVAKMEEYGYDSFVFENSEIGGATCMIYKRKKDSKYGIIQI